MTMFCEINESTMETEVLPSISNSAKISPSAHPSNIPVPKGWKSSDEEHIRAVNIIDCFLLNVPQF